MLAAACWPVPHTTPAQAQPPCSSSPAVYGDGGRARLLQQAHHLAGGAGGGGKAVSAAAAAGGMCPGWAAHGLVGLPACTLVCSHLVNIDLLLVLTQPDLDGERQRRPRRDAVDEPRQLACGWQGEQGMGEERRKGGVEGGRWGCS